MRHAPIPALIVGLLFGSGLVFSDLVNPARVLAFLDIAGSWDPTLAFVMASALVPSSIAYLVIRRLKRPLMAETFCIPQNRLIEGQLIGGAAVFGIGWGVAGICPGPAMAGLAFGRWEIWLIAGAMAAGMLLHRLFAATVLNRPSAPAPQAS